MPDLNFEHMFLHARTWGLPPSEFWAMTLPEWIAEATMHRDARRSADKQITEKQREELIDWVVNGG